MYPEYLVNLTRTCYQHSATSSMCSGLPSISQFSPTNFLIMGLPPDASSYRDYDFHSVPLLAVKCASRIAPATPISCSSLLPNFNATDQTCNSVISKVSFRFAHQAGRILDYQIKLWTQDSVTEGFAFNVEIVFFENEIVDLNETAFPPSLQRSGADGYVRGRPLLAGRLSNQNSIEMAPFPLPTEADRQSARGALYAWWVYPSGGDDCNDVSDPNRLSFVRFGINSYSACILRYNLSTLSNCTELEDQIKTILTRQWNSTTSTASAETPTHVGCLGASQPEVPSQWTPILFADDAMTERCTTSSGNNECANIIIGQHIRVVYAYQGKVTNPRATVLGAQIEYIRGNIKFLGALVWNPIAIEERVDPQSCPDPGLSRVGPGAAHGRLTATRPETAFGPTLSAPSSLP
ncbi:Tectonic-1 [Sparganum proliferum]